MSQQQTDPDDLRAAEKIKLRAEAIDLIHKLNGYGDCALNRDIEIIATALREARKAAKGCVVDENGGVLVPIEIGCFSFQPLPNDDRRATILLHAQVFSQFRATPAPAPEGEA